MQTIFTLANVYLPNQDQLAFLSSVVVRLEAFRTVNLILGGDLNTPLVPRLDSSTGKSHITPSTLTKIRSILTNLSLVDTWRILNPSGRDYTFFSWAHGSYSRIDYILLSQSLLDPECHIGIKLWSDHAPVHLTLGRPPRPPLKRQPTEWPGLLDSDLCGN